MFPVKFADGLSYVSSLSLIKCRSVFFVLFCFLSYGLFTFFQLQTFYSSSILEDILFTRVTS